METGFKVARSTASGASSVRDLDGIADRFAKVNHGRSGN
jgi:hypothetical protein